MKSMKRIISLILSLLRIAVCFTACDRPNNEKAEKINIGVMSGPTGMGMAKMIADNGVDSDKYSFKVFSAPTEATAELANGSLDMLCLPTNTAANLASKNNDYISVIAINTLGSLYVLTDEETTEQTQTVEVNQPEQE